MQAADGGFSAHPARTWLIGCSNWAGPGDCAGPVSSTTPTESGPGCGRAGRTFPLAGDPAAIELRELSERMLFAEALESVRCLDEAC